MFLSTQRNAIAVRLQVVDDALCAVLGKRVIRICPALNRVKSRVDVMPSRRAHRRRLKALSKPHAFFRQLINVRSQRLPAVTADVTMRAVVSDDEQKIRHFAVIGEGLRSHRVRRRHENGKSNKEDVAKRKRHLRGSCFQLTENCLRESGFRIESLVASERVRQLVGLLYLSTESAKGNNSGGRSCLIRPKGRECGCLFADGTLPIGNQWTLRAVLTAARISGENEWRMFAAER